MNSSTSQATSTSPIKYTKELFALRERFKKEIYPKLPEHQRQAEDILWSEAIKNTHLNQDYVSVNDVNQLLDVIDTEEVITNLVFYYTRELSIRAQDEFGPRKRLLLHELPENVDIKVGDTISMALMNVPNKYIEPTRTNGGVWNRDYSDPTDHIKWQVAHIYYEIPASCRFNWNKIYPESKMLIINVIPVGADPDDWPNISWCINYTHASVCDLTTGQPSHYLKSLYKY